jgi:exopolyphosphatase / guanosine-5'-triphosphate,3'-diphosphate pyrophosphatase
MAEPATAASSLSLGRPAAGRPTYAALDLGTNNCRLLVGTASGNGFVVLDRFSRMVCLGEGLERTGRLEVAAMDRAIEALDACAARLERWRPRGLAAIATEACRRAANGAEFLARVRRETGLPIAVISPREEVLLAIESCTPLLARSHDGSAATRALLFDIGGGSTELAWLRLDEAARPSLIGCASVPLGVVTLAERHGAAAFTASGFAAMVAEAAAYFAPFETIHCIAREIHQCEASRGVCLVGTSGTATTLAAIALDLRRYRHDMVDGTVLSREATIQALATLARLGRAGLERHPCIGPDRTAFVLPGAAIFAALHNAWPAPQMIVADRGLREGLLLRLIQVGHHGARRSYRQA